MDTTRPTLPADWGKQDKQALESTTTESAIIATTELLEDLLVLTTQSGKLIAYMSEFNLVRLCPWSGLV